ncbi:MAG: hypothetical protein ABIJ15_03995 [bacterium]
MKDKEIIFITEGGSKIGMGHLMRSIAVAERVRDKGRTPIFIVNKEKNVTETLKNYKFPFQTVSSIIKCDLNIKDKRVLIDSKKNVSGIIRKVKRNNCKVTLMDNATNARLLVNNVIYPIEHFDPDALDWSKAEGKLYYGAKYFPLRKDFLKHKRKKKTIKKGKNILISFGGADPNNLSLKMLKILNAHLQEHNIKIILGSAFKNKQIIRDYVAKYEMKVDVIDDSKLFPQILSTADLFITALGVSIYEANYFSVPVVVINNYKEDKKDSILLKNRNLTKSLGYYKSVTGRAVWEAVNDIIEEQNNFKKVVDSAGACRIAKIVIN